MFAALLQPAAPSAMRVLERGNQSAIDQPLQTVARNAAEWNALWRRHTADRPAPEVDFEREIVAAVFAGSRPTAGFAVEIVGTSEEGGVLVVEYRIASPPAGAMTAQVITAPYRVVARPRHDGQVRFEEAR